MCLFSCKKLVIYCTLSFELMFNYYFIIKPCNYARGKDIHGVSFDFDFTSYVQAAPIFFFLENYFVEPFQPDPKRPRSQVWAK